MIFLDLLTLSRELASSLRRCAAQRLGLKAGQVAIYTTHTHYAAATVFLRKAGEVDKAYVGFVEQHFIETFEASGEPFEAEVTVSASKCTARGHQELPCLTEASL